MNPDEVPNVLLKKLPDKSKLNDILDILIKYTLCQRINPNSSKVGVSIHRILKEDIHKFYFENDEAEKKKYETDLINHLDKLFPTVNNASISEWSDAELVYKNLRFVLSKLNSKNTDQLGKLYKKLEAYEQHVNFDYKQSLGDNLKSSEIFRNIYKSDHQSISSQLNSIGLIN